MEPINLYAKPKLRNPSLFAAWPGMGSVAIITARYLRDKLGAERFGRIEPYDFFEPSAVRIHDNILEEPISPENNFYFWRSRKGTNLIIFIAEAQPSRKGYTLANLVLDVAQSFGAERIYTSAAAPAHIYYAKKPRILGVATSAQLTLKLKEYNVKLMSSGSITGMNGVLLGVAKKRDMEGICLLGEMPIYMMEMTNPRSSRGVIEVLTQILDVEIDMTEIDDWVRKTDEEIEKNLLRLMTSQEEGARRLVEYFDRLKKQADVEEAREEMPQPEADELLKEIERFLKGQGGEKDDRG